MKKILTLILLTFVGINTMAQNRRESYNYQRGLEAIQDDNLEEALEYLNKEVIENPKNGYAYSWMAMLYDHDEKYGKALTAVELAIKYLPKKDVDYVVFAYATRGEIYLHLEDTTKAIANYTSAIKANPEQYNLYEKRAQIYFDHNDFYLAEADYNKMIELKPGDVMGHMGLGRNANAQEKWTEAISHFDYVIKLASDYSSGYAFRAESNLGLKKWNEATDDLISALTLKSDRKALYLISEMKEPALSMMIAKLRVQAAKSPNDSKWPYIIGILYDHNKEYKKAIDAYEDANTKDISPVTYYRIALCRYELGEFDMAFTDIDNALNMDSTDVDYMSLKANILYELGKAEQAICQWDKVLELYPEYDYGYYSRGWFKELTGNYEGAIDDLSTSVVLDSNYSYAYLSRADAYMKLGKRDLAESDYKKIIEIENSPELYECIQYAYQALGLYDEAMAAMDSIIARDSTDAGNYYDAACVYCRMGKKMEALGFLEKSFIYGFKRFSHIERDDDMDLIRETEEFKSLISKYNEKSTGMNNENDIYGREVVSEIPFVKENGVYKVQCKVNGLPLHFVFDTGAAEVTLSLVEANFMMKNGFLTGNDVIGSKRYMDANGDVSVGTVINIKEVSFGGFHLANVRASVVRNQRAPLLLGQSVLGRLGKIEIDNPGHVLKITHQEKDD